MSYTQSKAGIGLGTTLLIGDGANSEVFTPVGEIKSIRQSGKQMATEDVTNLQSTAREFIPTLLDSGAFDLTGNRIGSDAGQILVKAAFNNKRRAHFKIILPLADGQTTSGDTFTFTALVQEESFGVEVDKIIPYSAKLKVSGSITETAGS